MSKIPVQKDDDIVTKKSFFDELLDEIRGDRSAKKKSKQEKIDARIDELHEPTKPRKKKKKKNKSHTMAIASSSMSIALDVFIALFEVFATIMSFVFGMMFNFWFWAFIVFIFWMFGSGENSKEKLDGISKEITDTMEQINEKVDGINLRIKTDDGKVFEWNSTDGLIETQPEQEDHHGKE